MVRFCEHEIRDVTHLGFTHFGARRVSVSLSYDFVETRLRGKDGRACVMLNDLHVCGVQGRICLSANGVVLLHLNDRRSGRSGTKNGLLYTTSPREAPLPRLVSYGRGWRRN